MADPVKSDLEERVARLEAAVERLLAATPRPRPEGPPRSRPARLEAPPSVAGEPGAAPPSPASPPVGGRWSPKPSPYAVGGERWLSRVGVGFVVLAVAFLLKLSFDRGWVTPNVRLAAGFAIALGLLTAGLRLEPTRRRLAQALLGGAVSLFYLVGFAGYQLYALTPLWVALSLMSTTTLLSFVLAERQDSPILAVMGVLGGVATPFLLESGLSNVIGLSAYLGLVLLGGGGVQFHRGWISLLGVLVLGGAAALSPLALVAPERGGAIAVLAVLVYWMVTAVSRVARPFVLSHESSRLDLDAELWITRVVLVASTIVALVLVVLLLDLDLRGAGVLAGFLALLAAAVAHLTRGTLLSQWPSAEMSALCLAFAFILVLQGQSAMFFGVGEAAVLFVLVTRGAPRSLRTLGHLLATAVAVAFCVYAVDAPIQMGALREGALVRLAALAMVAVCGLLVEADAVPAYRGAAYLGLLIWLLSELAPKAHGAALVSIAWGVQGAVALLVSLRLGSRPLQAAGLATLGLVAAKLLLVDLSQLDAVWRILMFLGFGASLLGLAYLVNRPAKTSAESQRASS